ncbi:MAG TPA: TIM barrel protein [Anaerolineae bacterium]|jgi:sugar phosphate isomerase/epimerase|nr:TIM barrel protein [Anaerolineae bacterium]
MIELSISTSFIRGDVSKLQQLLRMGDFKKLEIGFYDEETLPLIMGFAKANELSYGFHDPLPRLPDDDYPFLTDPDDQKRWRTLDSMYRTMQTAVRYEAQYVIGHIPSVLWEPRPAISEDKILELAHRSCDQLSAWSQESGIPFILENVGPNPYFFRVAAFVEVLQAHPDLQFCLDMGHLHLMSIYAGYDAAEFARELAPYTTVVHIYNATPEMYRKYHHVPVHPSQRTEDGWADILGILGRVLEGGSKDLTLVFEYSPQYPAGEEFVKEGIEWVTRAATDEEATSRG